jgi:hypothetical protein
MSNEHLRKLATLSFTVALALAGVAALLWLWGWLPQAAFAQGPGPTFTYQGRLIQNGTPVSDTCDFQFVLWDASSGGTQKGVTQTVSSVDIKDGYFTTRLNEIKQFEDDAFTGDARWLGIRVQCPGDSAYADLGRQELTAAPYALYATSTGALHGRAVSTTAPTTGQVLKWDDSAWSPATVKGSPYANVIVVAKSGGDFTSIQAALDSITEASDTNRYLVWVAPGTYTERVTMKEYVDIEGAGELATKITYTSGESWPEGTVVGKNNAELRFLTVENTGGGTHATAIFNGSASPRLTHVTASARGSSFRRGVRNYSSSPKMTNVTAFVQGTTGTNYGVYNDSASSPTMRNVTAFLSSASGTSYGVYNDNASSPKMTNVTVFVHGGGTNYGVYNDNASSPTIQNSTISASGANGASYGIYNEASSSSYTVRVDNCQITGDTNTIFNGDYYTTLVGASLLSGGNVISTTTSSTVTCAGVYDESYTFYANTCP